MVYHQDYHHHFIRMMVQGQQPQPQPQPQQQQQQPHAVLQFVIVGRDDAPLFDADLTMFGHHMPEQDGDAGMKKNAVARPHYLYHFVLHASLDAMDDLEWTQKQAFLGVVDRFNNLQVSGYILPGNRLRLLLLHDGKSEEMVKTFFRGVHHLLVPRVLNPFFLPKERIYSAEFHAQMRRLSKHVFGV